MAMVFKWPIMYNYWSLVWPHSKVFFFFFPVNVVVNIFGGVKFVASLLYLKGKAFGNNGVTLVVF